jgi:hypothetical protein
MRNAYNVFVRKPEMSGSRRRPGHRWDDIIRMDLREIGWEVVDWNHLAQNRDQWRVLVNSVMNLRIP